MPRSPRIEYPGALYHVINRGNYRQDLFTVHRTAEAFENALFEGAERFNWRVHAYVVMSNHYHLAIETPRANLTGGMQWLQSVFANRFNRFCGANGHVFQGRYKALVVEPGASWVRVVDYIHLNPVRAGIVPLGDLRDYPFGSFPKWFWRRSRLPRCLTDETWRKWGGYGPGTRALRRYWSDLATRREGARSQRDALRRQLCRGWMIGSKRFAAELLEKLESGPAVVGQAGSRDEAFPETEIVWEQLLDRYLEDSGHRREDVEHAPKSAGWKLKIAARLKTETGVTNRWLAEHLHLGHPCSASRNISRWRETAK